MPDRLKTYRIQSHEGYGHLEVVEDKRGGWVRRGDLSAIQAKALSALSTVRGHLDGYADAIALTDSVNKAMLVHSLREDAEVLGSMARGVRDSESTATLAPVREEIEVEIDEQGDDALASYGPRILHSLQALRNTINRIGDDLMATLEALQAAVDSLVTAEGSAAAEMQALVAEIATLQAGSVTQEQIDAVTAKANDAVNALNAATSAAQESQAAPVPAEPPTEPAAPPAEEPPAPEPTPPADASPAPPVEPPVDEPAGPDGNPTEPAPEPAPEDQPAADPTPAPEGEGPAPVADGEEFPTAPAEEAAAPPAEGDATSAPADPAAPADEWTPEA